MKQPLAPRHKLLEIEPRRDYLSSMNGKSLSILLASIVLASSSALEAPANAPQKSVTANIAEIVKMNDSGVGEQVIKEFIQNSNTIFEPRADEIIYLHDHGVSGDVITSLIKRGAELKRNLRPPAQNSTQNTQYPVVTPAAPVQSPVVVQQPVVQTVPVPVYQPVYDPIPVYYYNYSFGYPWYYYRSPYAYPPLYTHYRAYAPWRYPSAHFNVNFGSPLRSHSIYSGAYFTSGRPSGGFYSGGVRSGGFHSGGHFSGGRLSGGHSGGHSGRR